LISFYTILKMIKELNITKGSILFVGNNVNSIDSLFYFFNIKNVNFFFIKKWFPGILTNYEALSSVFKKKVSRVKKVNKLRFFRYFYNIIKLEKPNLVIILQSTEALIIMKECYSQDIPVVYLGNNINHIKYFSYKIPANLDNFISYQLFLQLFVSQINNKNEEKKI